ncbi:MAG: response regulator [Pseudomonadota bacterium]
MMRLADMRMKPKLVLLFVLTGILPLAIVGFFGSRLAVKALMEKSFAQLITVQSIRKTQLETAFSDKFNALETFTESPQIRDFSLKLLAYYGHGITGYTREYEADALIYGRIIADYKIPVRNFLAGFGGDDFVLVCGDHGNILFSLAQGESLWNVSSRDNLANSTLETAWKRAVQTRKPVVVDFEPYAPLGGVESAFFANPVIDTQDRLLAVAVVRISPAFTNRILESRKGMGETGESYLLNWDGIAERFELRSSLQTMGNGNYVVGYSLDRKLLYWEDAVKKGLEGGSGTSVDSSGKSVLTAYNRLDILGLNWFLISKIDTYEVEAPVRDIIKKTMGIALALAILIGVGSFFFSRGITRPIIDDVQFAQAISQGQLTKTLEYKRKDELGKLAWSLNTMAANLRETDWLKQGKEGLEDALRGEHDMDELARRFIGFMVKHLEGQLGAIYLNDNGVLRLQASYAFTDRNGNFNTFSIGQGMVGQAALEQETIVFADTRGDAPMINYGAGETAAANYLVVPLSFEDKLLGVFLIGSVSVFTALQRRFVQQNVANAAILFNTARSRRMIQQLLDRARAQQEELTVKNAELEAQTLALKESEAELQSQQEELRVTNEELEEQTRALKASEAELQAQQEELRVTNEDLETRTRNLEEQKAAIREKNVELVKAQDAIRQKARELEIASRYKSEFLANMSHELRTPLNSILILSQLFSKNRDNNLTPKQVESALAIHSSGEDLLNLINEILDLSKVESGKIELCPEDIRIEDLMSDLRRIFDTISQDKGVPFVTRAEPGLPENIHTDPLRLQQVLRNLLTNAFKFTSQGQVTFTVSRPGADLPAGAVRNPDRCISFSVRDDGIGIPLDKQTGIFEAFQQADGGTSRKFGGTGLGLSISRELVRLLGGSIVIDSSEGQGSTFTIIIPERYSRIEPDSDRDLLNPVVFLTGSSVAVTEAQEASRKKISAPRPSEPLDAPGTKTRDMSAAPELIKDDRKSVAPGDKSLLVIEDDINFARIIRDFSRERGFKCIVAEDGETGLHFADYYKPSAIILDIGLPGIDGWTVMERLKENPELRHIPVHFMSASDSSMDAMRMGALGFLTKPVSLEKIDEAFARIESIITRPVHRLLVVEDDPGQSLSIRELIGNGDVIITTVTSGREAFQELVKAGYDCMILDLGLGDMSGFDLLEQMRQNEACSRTPVIVYTGRELTREEDEKLRVYTESIIIKGVKSPERLLEESALFLHRVESSMQQNRHRAMKRSLGKETVLADKTVLLVDDDMRNVFALTSVLEEKSMRVVVARDGRESIDKLHEMAEVDVVLMDIMMPRMDGYEAMQEIRKNSQFKALPIIALTAKAMKGDRNRCMEAGASDYLAKPVDTDKLLSMLRVWLYK